jgi:3-dehydroquinate dehydratase
LWELIENDAVVFIQTNLEGDLVVQIHQVASRQKKKTALIINLSIGDHAFVAHITNGRKHEKRSHKVCG